MPKTKKTAKDRYEDTKAYLKANPGTSIRDACKATKMNPNYFSTLQSKERKKDEARSILRAEPVHAAVVPQQIDVSSFVGSLPANKPVVMLIVDQQTAAQMLKGIFR